MKVIVSWREPGKKFIFFFRPLKLDTIPTSMYFVSSPQKIVAIMAVNNFDKVYEITIVTE